MKGRTVILVAFAILLCVLSCRALPKSQVHGDPADAMKPNTPSHPPAPPKTKPAKAKEPASVDSNGETIDATFTAAVKKTTCPLMRTNDDGQDKEAFIQLDSKLFMERRKRHHAGASGRLRAKVGYSTLGNNYAAVLPHFYEGANPGNAHDNAPVKIKGKMLARVKEQLEYDIETCGPNDQTRKEERASQDVLTYLKAAVSLVNQQYGTKLTIRGQFNLGTERYPIRYQTVFNIDKFALPAKAGGLSDHIDGPVDYVIYDRDHSDHIIAVVEVKAYKATYLVNNRRKAQIYTELLGAACYNYMNDFSENDRNGIFGVLTDGCRFKFFGIDPDNGYMTLADPTKPMDTAYIALRANQDVDDCTSDDAKQKIIDELAYGLYVFHPYI